MFTWIKLDHLPPVPEYFINLALTTALNASVEDHAHFGLVVDSPKDMFERKIVVNGETHNTRHQWGSKLNDEWEHWVKQNIISTFLNTGVRVSVGQDTTWHGAHCDVFKGPPKKFIYKLYYLIEPGGNPDTVFYKEVGKSFERTPDQDPVVNDYQQLEVVDRVKLPLKKWVLLNTALLHGVENVTSPRINLVVVIDIDQVDISVNLKGNQ